MAKLKFCQRILKIEGRLTGVTVRELSDEKLERRAHGTRSERVSQGQLHHRERLRQAAAYATAALADPYLRVVYEEMAAHKRITPRNMAMSDYLKGNNLLPKE
jgi:hypothetical protein